MKNFFIFLGFLLLSSTTLLGQGYKINVKVSGLSDSAIYLGYYYGKYQYVRDTAFLDKKGMAVFQTNDTVGGGVYFVVLPKQKYFEIIIDEKREFSLEVDADVSSKSLKAKNSKENSDWFAYKVFIEEKGEKLNTLTNEKKRLEAANKKDSANIISEEIDKINKEVIAYRDKYIETNGKNSLISKIFLATTDVEMPEAPLLEDGKKDSVYLYRYYRNHFWDNIDLTDDRFLRTPLYHNKLDQYFNRVLPQIPDTIIKELDVFIDKVDVNKEVFKYTVWYLTYNYETSQVMGMDAVFCFISDKIYAKNRAFWVSDNVNKKIIDAAEKKKPNLIGKVAPELILLGVDNQLVSLHAVDADYTILFFWDPSCGHCKEETPKLVNYYNNVKNKINLKIYAVCSDTSITKWKKDLQAKKMESFINVNGTHSAKGNYHDLYDVFTTPVIFILDKKKRIIAKRISAEQIEGFLDFYIKHPRFED